MIDLEAIEKKLASDRGHIIATADIAALIAEVRALREDAERYRWAIALEDNVETLYGAVISCGPKAVDSINIEVDMARGAK